MKTKEQLEELVKVIQQAAKKEFNVTIGIDLIRHRAIHRSQKLIEQFIDNRIGHLNLQDAYAFSALTSLVVEEQLEKEPDMREVLPEPVKEEVKSEGQERKKGRPRKDQRFATPETETSS